ncbi:methyltransferase, FxLD system [Streptomyces sp. NPDC003077]|uniref:methyltransferase, FxLD system n=1 Tax=Streptomyces sp. NPDC003077 TaxID=3154443 RepID=UPI0033B1447C
MNDTTEHPPADIEELRDSLVRELRDLRALRTSEVERAIRAVPRHLFVPEVPLSEAFAAQRAVVTKRDATGVSISSVSAVRVQAFMLEQAAIRPGMRVLEIGSGGYNAALIWELVGPSGEVTTIDIDPEVVERARRCLTAAGYERVRVMRADGEEGEPKQAPYDRILVTAGAWAISPAWVEQLAEGGRIVVPLRMRGLTRSVALEREDERLVSRSYELCGFVPMQGAGERRERLAILHEEEGREVGLRLDDEQSVDAERLGAALRRPPATAWSGVTVGGMEPFDDLDLWLATVLRDFALLAAGPAAREAGLVKSASPMGVPTLLDHGSGSFAYRTVRSTGEKDRYELGAYAHGPQAEAVADRLVRQIRDWDERQRGGPGPRFEVLPADTPHQQLPFGRVLDKGRTKVSISWP